MKIEDHLLSLNRRGIFPGPAECQKAFSRRAHAVQNPSDQQALSLIEKLFDASPDWVEVRYGAKGLLPWEGAATWIEEDENGGRVSSIQLKSSFLTRLYPLSEIIAHEMVHAMRLTFEESRFEEILAFCTSKNRFRRYFGPLFTQPAETKGFMFLTMGSWVFYWVEFFSGLSLGAQYVLWTPLLLLAWGIYRLIRSQRVFSQALRQLGKALKRPEMALAVALRLSDKEIKRFAKNSPTEIIAFAEQGKANHLRWRQIYEIYF